MASSKLFLCCSRSCACVCVVRNSVSSCATSRPEATPPLCREFTRSSPFCSASHGAIQNANLAVQLAQRKVISRQLGSDHQPHVFQIRSASLICRFRRFNAAPPSSKQIDLITGYERKRERILLHCSVNGKARIGAVAGKPLAFSRGGSGAGGQTKSWEECGDLDGCCSTSLLQACDGHFDGLVGVDGLLFQPAQLIVMKNCPPFAFWYQVLWCAFAPWLLYVPGGRDRCGWPVIIWAHGAASEARGQKKPPTATLARATK